MTEENDTLLPDSSGWVYAQEDVNGYARSPPATNYRTPKII